MNSQNTAGGPKKIAVLGAHGGAGVSTVAAFLDPSRTGQAIELTPGSELPLYYMPVVVARSSTYGMSRAAAMLTTGWHPQLPRPWLVIVRDAPMAPPRPARYRQRALGSRVLGTAEVPYLYRLRTVDTPAEAFGHKAVDRAAARLRSALGLPQ